MSNPSIYLPPMMFQEMRFPNSTMRLKMLNRLNSSHYRIYKEYQVEANSIEELDDLAGTVVCIGKEGWIFDGLCGDDEHGAYLSFYRMVPWSEEEIKEAKDWLEKNPQDPVEWRKVVTTVYE